MQRVQEISILTRIRITYGLLEGCTRCWVKVLTNMNANGPKPIWVPNKLRKPLCSNGIGVAPADLLRTGTCGCCDDAVRICRSTGFAAETRAEGRIGGYRRGQRCVSVGGLLDGADNAMYEGAEQRLFWYVLDCKSEERQSVFAAEAD